MFLVVGPPDPHSGIGIFWDQAYAEAMLQVRALVISKHRDERLAAILMKL